MNLIEWKLGSILVFIIKRVVFYLCFRIRGPNYRGRYTLVNRLSIFIFSYAQNYPQVVNILSRVQPATLSKSAAARPAMKNRINTARIAASDHLIIKATIDQKGMRTLVTTTSIAANWALCSAYWVSLSAKIT